MGSTAFIIHIGFSDLSSGQTLLENLITLTHIAKCSDRCIFDDDLSLRAHSSFKFWPLSSIFWDQEVTKLVSVDFDHITR